jgi:hypothetical protein
MTNALLSYCITKTRSCLKQCLTSFCILRNLAGRGVEPENAWAARGLLGAPAACPPAELSLPCTASGRAAASPAATSTPRRSMTERGELGGLATGLRCPRSTFTTCWQPPDTCCQQHGQNTCSIPEFCFRAAASLPTKVARVSRFALRRRFQGLEGQSAAGATGEARRGCKYVEEKCAPAAWEALSDAAVGVTSLAPWGGPSPAMQTQAT